MAARKEVEKTIHLREFQRTVSQLLSPEDKDYLFYAMKEYNTYKSVAKLMLALNSCLDTPEKLDLLPYVRDLIPKHDRKRFDNLAPYNRMAHPLKLNRVTGDSLGKLENERETTDTSSRIISLQRSPDSSLGFSIRGGREHDLGIFISHVDSFSLAEQSGLQVGDQIIAVNGISFDRLSHSSAVLVLRSHDNLKIEVKNMGCLPGQKLGHNSFIWVDPSGNPVEEQEQSSEHPVNEAEEREKESGSRLLTTVGRHKVVLHTSKKRPMGFSVRGGSEYNLGIYISMVDKGSPADEAGLQVGDQIMDVNGHSFSFIFHQEAVYILRSYPTLIMTIKSLGRVPALAPAANNRQSQEENTETEQKTSKVAARARSFSLPRKFSFKGFSASPKTGRKDTSEEKPRAATVKRSHSERRSLPAGTDAVDFGVPSTPATGQKTNSPGLGSANNRRKPIAISPLATHESRASPATPTTNSSSVAPKFFEHGVGSQVMLASMSSQAKQLLLDHARRKMNASDVTALKEDLEKYERSGNITDFVDGLIPLLNTASKMHILADVRSVLNPAHVVDFDEMVSPLEVEALHRSDSESDMSEEDVMQDYSTALTSAETQRWSKIIPIQSTKKKPSLPDLAALEGMATKKQTLQKASSVANSDPNLSGYLRESAVEHHKTEPEENVKSGNKPARAQHSFSFSKPSPVVVEIPKNSTFLGMAIKGGMDTPLKSVYVRELREGGAVHNEGFVKPGFEVVQVDDKRIRGKTYTEAVESIAESYHSDSPTIKLIVIPNQ